jgi:epoxyqueuosine reductase
VDRRATAERLRGWALAAGFDRAGVAALEPSAHGDVLRRWLDRGEHASMAYMARRLEARLDPRALLPEARSVLCVALRYGGGAEPGGDLWPRVARYARGRDYHEVMGERLAALARQVREAYPGCATRPYVDTGPLLERELAARAGLGAVGKNTMLLHPGDGSWFLLGELLLTLDLAPDLPLADLCGSCTRCLEACPTGALAEPYRLDANRCISYWTIEHRGAVPAAVRPRLGDWVFGCDLCQEACPWNAAPPPASDPAFELPPERRELDLAGLLTLGREAYVERFRGSPLKRAKHEGLRRNAAVAMGNRGDRTYVPALAAALRQDPSALVRGHAAWGLGRVGGEAAAAALAAARRDEEDPEVRREIDAALGEPAAAARPLPGVE